MIDSSLIHLGKLSGVHGVKGWLKVYSFTRPTEGILEYSQWLISKAGKEPEMMSIADGRKQGRGILVKLSDIDSRTEAEQLIGYDIHISRSDLPAVAQGEYYWVDLIGLNVHTEQGVLLGKVTQIMETGANDVLVVDGERERLIPYVQDHYIKVVDLEKGMITVDWDEDF